MYFQKYCYISNRIVERRIWNAVWETYNTEDATTLTAKCYVEQFHETCIKNRTKLNKYYQFYHSQTNCYICIFMVSAEYFFDMAVVLGRFQYFTKKRVLDFEETTLEILPYSSIPPHTLIFSFTSTLLSRSPSYTKRSSHFIYLKYFTYRLNSSVVCDTHKGPMENRKYCL